MWVTEGVDMCKVGYLPREYVKHGPIYDGILCQIIDSKSPTDPSMMVHKNWHHNCGYSLQ